MVKADQFLADGDYLRALITEGSDLMESDAGAKLVTWQAKYSHQSMPGMPDLVARAMAARQAAEHQADLNYLNALLDGAVDCMAEGVFPRLELMFRRYPETSATYPLREKAAAHFGDLIYGHACWVLAGSTIQSAQRDREMDWLRCFRHPSTRTKKAWRYSVAPLSGEAPSGCGMVNTLVFGHHLTRVWPLSLALCITMSLVRV